MTAFAIACTLFCFIPVQGAEPEQAGLPDLDAFRERVAELRVHAMHASFADLHGEHIESTTFAVRKPLGQRLPDATKDPKIDGKMRSGFYTYNGVWGTAQLQLVDRWVTDPDAVDELLVELSAYEYAFRSQLGPWITSTDTNFIDVSGWAESPKTARAYGLAARPCFAEGGWGPALTLKFRVEPGPGPDGEASHRIRAWLSGFSVELDDKSFPGGPVAYDQLYPGDRTGDWQRLDPRIAPLAGEFVAWLGGGDRATLRAMIFTAEEARDWELRRSPRHMREPGDEPLSAEEFEEMRAGIVTELVDAAEWSRRYWAEEWPVFDSAQLRVAEVRSLTELLSTFPENPEQWTEEQVELSDYLEAFDGAFNEIAFVTVEAAYPDSAPLRFELELLVLRSPERVSLAGLGDDLSEVSSAPVTAFTDRAVTALLRGDLDAYRGLLADEGAAKWMLEHRASTGWSRQPTAQELVPDAGEAIDRYHLLREPLELQGWEQPDSVEVERVELLSSYSVGACAQVWIVARLKFEDGSEPLVQLSLEALHGGDELKLVPKGRFELQVLKEARSVPLSNAGIAARATLKSIESSSRSLRNASDEKLQGILQREQAFLESLFDLDEKRRIRGLTALALAHEERHHRAAATGTADAADLLTAASQFDNAQSLELRRKGQTFRECGALLGDATTLVRLQRIAVGCIQAAGPASERGEDVVQLYEAAAMAGSWLLQRRDDPGLRSPLAQCALVAARMRAGFGATDGAAELLERYLPLQEETATLGADELATSVGLDRAKAAEAYGFLARLAHGGAVAMHERRVASQRPRPALRLRAIERAEQAVLAARCAARVAPEGAEDTSLIDACEQLVAALRAS